MHMLLAMHIGTEFRKNKGNKKKVSPRVVDFPDSTYNISATRCPIQT